MKLNRIVVAFSLLMILTMTLVVGPLFPTGALFSNQDGPNDLTSSADVSQDYAPGELIVWFYDNATESQINETITRLGTHVINSSVQIGLGQYIKLYFLDIFHNLTVWETVYKFWGGIDR